MNQNTPILAPEVGMAATILGWTDRYPATVFAVSPSGNRVTVQEDSYTRIDDNGMSECQEYEYERNPNGRKLFFSKRKNGRFVEIGQQMGSGFRLCLGQRQRYYDFSF